MEITTTIIIPNYNGLKFMDECIRSLNAQTYPNFRTLVVDNGSTDGSVEWLKEHQIDTIFLPENTGFSGAVNVGIKAADTPYVLLLNNDVRVDEYFVAEMVRAIGQSERIFSVSSRMIQMYHPMHRITNGRSISASLPVRQKDLRFRSKNRYHCLSLNKCCRLLLLQFPVADNHTGDPWITAPDFSGKKNRRQS